MSTTKYSTGEEYPNLKGTVSWKGSIRTDTITGVMVANGASSGPFTGALTVVSVDSENATESTWSWSYDVRDEDTVEGSYDICLMLTHNSGEIEKVIPTNPKITVEAC